MLPPEYHAQRLDSLPYQRSLDEHFERGHVVAIDFDETISDNPLAWLAVMSTLERNGYTVVVVTWRPEGYYPEDLEFLVDKGYKIYYTALEAKQPYMARQGIDVSIWIDDNPFAILNDAPNRTTGD